MSRRWIGLVFLVLVALFATAGAAQEPQAPPAFTMEPAHDPGDAEPFVLGGRRADDEFWPATFVFEDLRGHGCTSTLVGPRVVLTAAHCIPDGAVGEVLLRRQRVRLRCDHHDDYQDGVSDADPQVYRKTFQDFALCLAEQPLALPAEWVSTDPAELFVGLPITLLGFGCTGRAGSRSDFGVLYEGDTSVANLPSEELPYLHTRTGATACSGDSGGAAYLHLNSTRTRRVAVAVTSRSNGSESLLSSIADPQASEWLRRWSATNDVGICGVSDDVRGCRPR